MAKESIIEKYQVINGKAFQLKNYTTNDTCGYSKKESKADLKDHQERMWDLQERLYTDDSKSLLIIFQAIGISICKYMKRPLRLLQPKKHRGISYQRTKNGLHDLLLAKS